MYRQIVWCYFDFRVLIKCINLRYQNNFIFISCFSIHQYYTSYIRQERHGKQTLKRCYLCQICFNLGSSHFHICISYTRQSFVLDCHNWLMVISHMSCDQNISILSEAFISVCFIPTHLFFEESLKSIHGTSRWVMHGLLTDDIIKCHILLLCNWVLKVTSKVVKGKQYEARRNCIMLYFEI